MMKREDGNLSMKKSIVDEGKSDRTGEAAEAHISRKSVSPLSSSNDNRQANSSIAEKEQAISEKNELVGKENHTQRKSPNKDVIQASRKPRRSRRSRANRSGAAAEENGLHRTYPAHRLSRKTIPRGD